MNQLFYYIAGGIKSDAKNGQQYSEVIVRGKRSIKQIRNWLKVLFYFTVKVKNFLFLKKKLRSRVTLFFNNYFLIKYKILLTTEKKTCVFIG